MTSANELQEAWDEAEKVAKYVHLHKVGEGRYVAQVLRNECVCKFCGAEREDVSPVVALRMATSALKYTMPHISQEEGSNGTR